jgi:hypothetical protein
LNLTLPADLAGRFLAAVEASREAAGVAVARESQGPGSVDGGDSPSLEAARAFSTSRVPIPAWIGLLSMLEDFVETWDGGTIRKPTRSAGPTPCTSATGGVAPRQRARHAATWRTTTSGTARAVAATN